jgi:hypothetical protein
MIPILPTWATRRLEPDLRFQTIQPRSSGGLGFKTLPTMATTYSSTTMASPAAISRPSENIRARAHFLVLLTPTALERCSDPNDWMRREIEAAPASQRNIVPLMLAGFNFGAPATASQLTGKLAVLKKYNALPIPQGYFSPAIKRLRNKFLNLQVDAVLHPTWIKEYNEARSHHGTLVLWQDPDADLLGAMPMTKEKMIAA